MKLTYFQHDPPNFGDELNRSMWTELLPNGFLDNDPAELFMGIGSILWDDTLGDAVKHVIGSGYGGYTAPPDMQDGSWNVAWVRGPRTAEILKLDPKLAIADAAILLRATTLPAPDPHGTAAFMPHFDRAPRAPWARICARAGLTYLDPRGDPGGIVSRIRGARLLITEAMHGAIVADALRTPWIAVLPMEVRHRMKWDDWAESLGIVLRAQPLPPATMLELYMAATGLAGKGARSRRVATARPFAPVSAALGYRASRLLRRIAERVEPQLSDDTAITRATERCMEALDHFVAKHQR